jgi:hypothetical protein
MLRIGRVPIALALVLGFDLPCATAQDPSPAFASYATLTPDRDSLSLIGIVVDAASGAPLHNAQIHIGDGGVLSNADGWFRGQVSAEADSIGIVVQRIGYYLTRLFLTRDGGPRRFFLVREDTSFCESILPNGRQPGRVSLHVRDLRTGNVTNGEAEVLVTNANSREARYERVQVHSGQLVTGIDAPGAYELSVSVQGYASAVLGPFVVAADDCSTNRTRSQRQPLWLMPLD